MARGEGGKTAKGADSGAGFTNSVKFTKSVNIPDRLDAAADRLEEAAKYGRATAEMWRRLDNGGGLKNWSLAALLDCADDDRLVAICLDLPNATDRDFSPLKIADLFDDMEDSHG